VFNVVRHLKGRGGVATATLVTRTGRRGAPTTFSLTGVGSTVATASVRWGAVYDGIPDGVAEHRRNRAAFFSDRAAGRAA